MNTAAGFYITHKETRVSDYLAELYPDDSVALSEGFYKVNAHLKANQTLKQGYLFYVPLQTCLQVHPIAELQKVTAEIHRQQQQMSPQELFIVDKFENLLAYIDSGTIRTVAGDIADGFLAKATAHKNFVEARLIKLEELYRTTLIHYGHFPHSFYQHRAELFHQLEASLNQWIRSILIPEANPHNSLKSQLRLSSKSILHRWYKEGADFSLKEFAKRYQRLQQLAKHLANRGHVLMGLDVGFAGYNILNACTQGIDKKCMRTGFIELAQIVGSELGSRYGFGYGMEQCAASFAIPLPGSTSISCTIVAGAVTVASTEIGSFIASTLAGVIFDYSYPLLVGH